MLENSSTNLSTNERPSYAGIWVPIVTPFADDAARSVDYGALYLSLIHISEPTRP